MNIDTIKKTAICIWDTDSECYVVRSPLMKRVSGAAETPEEAWKLFTDILEDTMELMKKGQFVKQEGPGRPRKDRVRLNTDLDPDIKASLEKMAKTLHISQGEAIDICVFAYKTLGTSFGK
jgi:predicted RNase H-like HicB family nuclease